MSRWVPTVVESLCESKRLGLPFDPAWGLALARHPPRLHELGVSRVHEDTLLDQSAAGAVQWFRGVCEAAYGDWPRVDVETGQPAGPSRMRGLRAALEGGFAEPQHHRVKVTPRRSAAA